MVTEGNPATISCDSMNISRRSTFGLRLLEATEKSSSASLCASSISSYRILCLYCGNFASNGASSTVGSYIIFYYPILSLVGFTESLGVCEVSPCIAQKFDGIEVGRVDADDPEFGHLTGISLCECHMRPDCVDQQDRTIGKRDKSLHPQQV